MVKRIIFDLFSMFLCCSAFLCLCEAGRAQSANDIFGEGLDVRLSHKANMKQQGNHSSSGAG